MSELNLVLSEKFDTRDAATIHAELSGHLRVSAPKTFVRRSITVSSFIQLLGDVSAWLPLTAAAAIYFSTIAKRAGDATWDRLTSSRTKKAAEPLTDVASTLTKSAQMVDGEVIIRIGLDIPDDVFGTVLFIKSEDPAVVVHHLAHFIIHVNEISRIMQAAVKKGHGPAASARIEVQKDGSILIEWRDRNFKEHEAKIESQEI